MKMFMALAKAGYAPVRDPLDYTVFIGSHYRVKRATFNTVTDGLQTDW